MATLPAPIEGVGVDTLVDFEDYPTFTFYIDPITNTVRGMTDGHQAMVQAVEIALSVERYMFQIYTPNSGVELRGLIGEDYGFITSELKRRIKEAFIPDNRVTSVDDFVFTPLENGAITATFVVHTVYGDINSEMGVTL
ncbi:MAG: DUF2634 domain-containing protein [Oscillospiraceae bacterium]|jgi:hypothetical protein|nr:DUF2634 domain-containing protein [Oscillospiraceae bacterium]